MSMNEHEHGHGHEHWKNISACNQLQRMKPSLLCPIYQVKGNQEEMLGPSGNVELLCLSGNDCLCVTLVNNYSLSLGGQNIAPREVGFRSWK